jgi:hypothetical protein
LKACLCRYAKALSGVLEKGAAHHATGRDTCPRTGAPTGVRACEGSGLRRGTTPTSKNRSAACRAQKSDRTAPGAFAKNEVCSRTVLSRCYGPEPETTCSFPELEIFTIGSGAQLIVRENFNDDLVSRCFEQPSETALFPRQPCNEVRIWRL